MPRLPVTTRRIAVLALFIAPSLPAQTMVAQGKPTIEQFLSPASPLEITSARKADRVAWMTYDRGLRNVYTAAAPDFRAVRITSFLKDDGTDLSDVNLTEDGTIAIFVRGSAPNAPVGLGQAAHEGRVDRGLHRRPVHRRASRRRELLIGVRALLQQTADPLLHVADALPGDGPVLDGDQAAFRDRGRLLAAFDE